MNGDVRLKHAGSLVKAFGLAFILVVVSPQMLFAQASVSGGFGLPLVLLPSSSDLARTIGPALWGEAAFGSPSRVVSLHTGLDWSTPYKKEWRRGTRVTGSGTYQETMLSQGIGIRLRSTERSEITAVGSFGIVFMRIDETARIASGGLGPAQTQRTRATRIDPSVLGGINASANVNDRLSMTFRIRLRLSAENEFDSLAIVPSVGFRFILD